MDSYHLYLQMDQVKKQIKVVLQTFIILNYFFSAGSCYIC